MLTRFYTRRCRGCTDNSPHSHHLTWLGRLHYIGWPTREGADPGVR